MSKGLMKLDDFIKKSLPNLHGNAYVTFPGFTTLYVRVARRYIEGELVRTIDLASMETRYKGKGSFKKLFAHLRSQWTELPIFVENVLSDRLCEGLLRMGFKEVKEYGPPPSFYFSAEANTCALKEG